jgi:hypothetical protein
MTVLPPPTERQTQRAILAMCGVSFRDVLIHHSPNGSKLAGSLRDRQVAGGILKGDGMKAGWPDLVCHWAGGGTCYIEVKRPKLGIVSTEQKAIHAKLTGLGIPVATVTTHGEAYTFLRQCGAPCSAEMIGVGDG